MTRKSKKERNTEQVIRQSKVRAGARAKRRPSRDDIARMFLWQMIVGVQNRRKDPKKVLARVRDEIVDGLVAQGFDGDEGMDVFDALALKYADGLYPFRPKRHLCDMAATPSG